MAEFAYNNAKNTSTRYVLFELNCKYHLCVSCKKDVNSRSRSEVANEMTKKLRNFMTVYKKTYNMPKNCKNETTIKKLSLKAMLLAKKFG